MLYPIADPVSLPHAAPSRIHVHSMTQPAQAPSSLPAVAGIKAGKSGESVSPSASRPGIIAVEGEGGFAYLDRMMAQHGPAGTGKSKPQASDTLFPSVYIYIPPRQLIYMSPVAFHSRLCQKPTLLSTNCQSARLPLQRLKRTSRSSLPFD